MFPKVLGAQWWGLWKMIGSIGGLYWSVDRSIEFIVNRAFRRWSLAGGRSGGVTLEGWILVSGPPFSLCSGCHGLDSFSLASDHAISALETANSAWFEPFETIRQNDLNCWCRYFVSLTGELLTQHLYSFPSSGKLLDLFCILSSEFPVVNSLPFDQTLICKSQMASPCYQLWSGSKMPPRVPVLKVWFQCSRV